MPPLKPLPDCEGPKLEPFEHDLEADDVEFLKILEPDFAAHSKIIKTRIGDKIYSIKFFVWEQPFAQPPYTSALKEVGREDLAVKVHGYVALDLTDAIDQKLQAARSKMIRPYAKLEWFLGMDNGPSMGIVKDWVDEVEYNDRHTYDLYQQVVQVSHFPRMLEGLHGLHKHGIVVLDLSDRQYVNGTLVDLSMASTVPHPFGPDPDPLGLGKCWQPRWTFQSLAAWDLYCFQKYVIDAWDIGLAEFLDAKPGTKGLRKTCWLQAYRLPSQTRNLRPRDRRYPSQEQSPYLPLLNQWCEVLEMTHTPRHDPLDFAKHTPVIENVKKREAWKTTGQGVKKRVAKGKQVKGKKVNRSESKSKVPGSRASGLRDKTVKK